MELNYQYMKRRFNCGKQPMYSEQGPELCDSIASDPILQKLYILRNPVHQNIQNTPSYSKNQVNTIRAEFGNTGINHTEGGWPKDVAVTDPEATQRYRRRIEKDDSYIHCVRALENGMDHLVTQNNAINMYETYYADCNPMPEVERNSLRTVNEYRDEYKRPVSSICWQPESRHYFAVTYVDVDFNRIIQSSGVCHIWDVYKNNRPIININPPCALLDLQYNPKDTNTLAGGLINGQVAIWDQRKGGPPVNICPPHVAHRDMARNVLYIASKSGQEFFSSGPDGVCKWWDCRNMNEFTEEMLIDTVKNPNDIPTMPNTHGVSVLEYEPLIPSKFMVGTENGLVITGNRKGKTALEKLPLKYEAHTGPIWSLERNPGFTKNFLTVGDWTARVWSEDCRESAILWTPPMRHKITSGAWSPTRLSTMMLTQWNGVVTVWDFLRRYKEPVVTMQTCREPLLKVTFQEEGRLAACGSRTGNIYMLEMSHSLMRSGANDKALLGLVFDRESKRERILEARIREIKLKMRQAEEGSPTHSVGEPDPTIGDKDLDAAAVEYTNFVKKELALLNMSTHGIHK